MKKKILLMAAGFIAALAGFFFVMGSQDNRCITESFCFGPITSQMLLYHERYAAFPPSLDTFVQAATRPMLRMVYIEYPCFLSVKKEILPVLYNPYPDLSDVDRLSNLIVAAPLVIYGERKCIFFLDPAQNEYYIKSERIPEKVFQKYWQYGDDGILQPRPKAERAR